MLTKKHKQPHLVERRQDDFLLTHSILVVEPLFGRPLLLPAALVGDTRHWSGSITHFCIVCEKSNKIHFEQKKEKCPGSKKYA